MSKFKQNCELCGEPYVNWGIHLLVCIKSGSKPYPDNQAVNIVKEYYDQANKAVSRKLAHIAPKARGKNE